MTKQTYEPGNADIGPQMAEDQVQRGPGRGHVHHPGLHGAGRADGRQAQLPAAARRLQRRHRPDDADRPAQGVLQGQGTVVADRRDRHRRLPAAHRRHLQQLGQAVPADPRTVHPEAALRRQRRVRDGRRVHVRAGAPEGGEEPHAAVDRQRGRDRQAVRPGLVPFAYAKDEHSGYTGTQIGVIKGGAIKLSGSPQTTDDGSGAITDYSGSQPSAPANGIPAG